MIKFSVSPASRRHVLTIAGTGAAVALAVWAVVETSGVAAPTAPAPGQRLSASRWQAPPTPLPGQPAAPPQPCPDRVLRVRAEVLPARPDRLDFGHRPADNPVARLVVVNTGQTACTRDLGEHRELLLASADGGRTRWLSRDCAPETAGELRIMHPGEEYGFPLTEAHLGRPVAPVVGADPLAPQGFPVDALLDAGAEPACPPDQPAPSAGASARPADGSCAQPCGRATTATAAARAADNAWPVVRGDAPPAGDHYLVGRLGELTTEPVAVRLG